MKKRNIQLEHEPVRRSKKLKFELLSNWGEEENVMKTTFGAWKTTVKEPEGYEGAGGAPEQEGERRGRQASLTTPKKERK